MGTSSSSQSPPPLEIKQRSQAALHLTTLYEQCSKYDNYEFDHSYIYLLSEKIRLELDNVSKSLKTPKEEQKYNKLLHRYELLKSKYGSIRGEEL